MKQGPEGNMSRRTFGLSTLAAGAIAAAEAFGIRLSSAEAQNINYEFTPLAQSPEAQKALEEAILKAADSLIDPAWDNKEYREELLLGSYYKGAKTKEDVRQMMFAESELRIPSADECARIERQSKGKLSETAAQIAPQRFGLFLDGNTQTYFVLQKVSDREIKIVAAVTVSTSGRPWNNAQNTGGTPLDLHGFSEHKQGLLGEVLTEGMSGPGFVRKSVNGKLRTFVRGLHIQESGGIPTVITDAFPMASHKASRKRPRTSIFRKILTHATNDQGRLGERRSGGCVRLKSVDLRYLSTLIDTGRLNANKDEVEGGTPVMIHVYEGSEVAESEKRVDPPVPQPPRDAPRSSAPHTIEYDLESMSGRRRRR